RGEEERVAARKGAAGGAADVVAAVLGFPGGGALKVVAGVEILVAQDLDPVTVERVRACFGGEIAAPAVEAAELGRRAVALDLELLHRVDDRKVRHLAGLGLKHGDAVEQVLV